MEFAFSSIQTCEALKPSRRASDYVWDLQDRVPVYTNPSALASGLYPDTNLLFVFPAIPVLSADDSADSPYQAATLPAALELPGYGVPVCPLSFCLPPLPLPPGAGQFGHLVDSGPIYENLGYFGSPSAWNPQGPYASSGAYLERLQGAFDGLTRFNDEQAHRLNDWFGQIEESLKQEGKTDPAPYFSVLGLEKTLEIINSVQDPLALLGPVALLKWIFRETATRKLLQHLLRGIQVVKQVLYQASPRFCGLSWSRRLWFLLHGSHPPKPESWFAECQEFGRA